MRLKKSPLLGFVWCSSCSHIEQEKTDLKLGLKLIYCYSFFFYEHWAFLSTKNFKMSFIL